MFNYKFLYLIWLLPAYYLFLTVHQGAVFYSITDTYKNGSSYTAEVIDFNTKQIGTLTNGYIVLRFETAGGKHVQQKLTLPVEMAGELLNIRIVPVRYQEDSFQNIVMIPTFSTQKGLVLTNIAMALVGVLITLFVAFAVHRYAGRKLAGNEEKLVIERID